MIKMTLGKRIGLGFGILLMITIVIGGWSMINMKGVCTQTTLMSKEFAPEVVVANNIERSYAAAMLQLRSYGYTGDAKNLEEGRQNLVEMRKYLEDAQKLGATATELGKLKTSADEIEGVLIQYEKLIEETVK